MHNDEIALLIWGAFRHPEKSARMVLRTALEQWTESCHPHYDEKEIADAFLQARGSVLEPFIFPQDFLDESVALARVAFSSVFESQRVFIENPDPELPCRGIVLTRSLSHACLERYSFGTYRKPPARAWSLHLPYYPSKSNPGRRSHGSATLDCSDEGIEIRIRWPDPCPDEDLIRQLEKHSRLEGQQEMLSRLGLSIMDSGHSRSFSIRTGSPESMIRFMAILQEGGHLHLCCGDDAPFSMRVTLEGLGEHGKVSLAVTSRTNGSSLPWLRAMSPRVSYLKPGFTPPMLSRLSPPIPPEGKAALARYFPYPGQWQDTIEPLLHSS